MQVIDLKHPYPKEAIKIGDTVLALGFFDGVHLGHQRVIKEARRLADVYQVPLAVLTFNHTPLLIYQTIHPHTYGYLSDQERKIELMEELGVDILYVASFTSQLGALSPQEFVDQYIVGLHALHVVAGFDYTYGLKDVANMTTLKEHSKNRFKITEIPKQTLDQHKIGSTSIRQYLLSGQIEAANQELGYTYQTQGVVINGLKRGRTIGYPTANVAHRVGQLLPKIGVYIVEIKVQETWYQGMASIGYNITFDDIKDLSVEVHILDFDLMIYGEDVSIKWHTYLRDEQRFDGIDGLVAQLDQDLQKTHEYFAKHL